MGTTPTSKAPFANCHSVARRSETRSGCGENWSYGRISQSGRRNARSFGANHAISAAMRSASCAEAVRTRSGACAAVRRASQRASAEPLASSEGRDTERCALGQTTATGILPIFARHSAGPVRCTALPPESTATVTGMSFTSNSRIASMPRSAKASTREARIALETR